VQDETSLCHALGEETFMEAWNYQRSPVAPRSGDGAPCVEERGSGPHVMGWWDRRTFEVG